jgi:hypothetical protein
MKLARGERVHGVPAIKLRDALRRMDQRGSVSARMLGDKLGLDERETAELILRLLADGLLEERIEMGTVAYEVTEKGHIFCLASGLKKVPRAKIEALLERVLASCAEINADGCFPMYVKSVRVFGSYLERGNELGDLDVAVEAVRRNQGMSKDDFAKWSLEFGGRKCPNAALLGRIFCASRLLWKQLKGRSPYVSLHTLEELKELGARSRMVFLAKNVALPKPYGRLVN